MNILVFTTAFHPSIGGLEKQTLALIPEFIKKGHRVKVINMQFQSVTIRYSTSELQGIDIYNQPGFLKKLTLFFWCDVLYMPNLSLKGIWLFLINPFKKWVISHNDFYLSNNSTLTIKIKLMLIKFATHNVAVSKSVAGYINTKSTIIYNCYDNDVFKIYDDEKRIFDFVFLGRLVSQKGCALLINACKSLLGNFTLNIIGDGPERPVLEQMINECGLAANIKFLGILEGTALARALNKHRVMIIPSIGEEGFGIVALEGMACGCKIIFADAGGLSEAVNGFGKKFTMRDQKTLEHLLQEEIGKNKSTASSISEELNNYLNFLKKETIAQQYLQLFQT